MCRSSYAVTVETENQIKSIEILPRMYRCIHKYGKQLKIALYVVHLYYNTAVIRFDRVRCIM